ncbi:MAG: nitrile hydratase subunit beta [Gammaproteobacteria bacterium]|jgi:nitrile hydratase
MNSIHDMGGMDNMGALEIEPDEPVFHAPWEGRVYGLLMSWGSWGRWSQWGSFRYALEQIAPADYLSWSYYEKWFSVHERKALETGIVTPEELQAGRADPSVPMPELSPYDPPSLGSRRLQVVVPADFQPGERVHTREWNPVGHIRLPRYVRDKTGEIVSDNGVYALQDTDASGIRLGNTAQRVYTVKFSARELWGERGHVNDYVYVDLWESYLEHP